MEHKEHFHGSDLEKIEKVYGIKKEDIISFSANVNPLGLSPRVKEALSEKADCLTSYPDREYTGLRKAIAAYTGVDFNHVLVGNGSSELISLFGKVCCPQKALILGPTYSEYEHSIALAGGKCSYFELRESANFVLDKFALYNELGNGYDLLILCNPNNPTGALIGRNVMEDIVKYCASLKINVIVDETYIEFVEGCNDVTAVSLAATYKNLVVLRGISKFFAAPGLRLGYGVTSNKELIRSINDIQVPWSINSLAEALGTVMFNDYQYMDKTRDLISLERSRVYSRLLAIPCIKAYRPTCNFILCHITSGEKTAEDLFEAAIKEKLMIRNCESFTYLDNTFFRFCFMKPEDNDKLLSVIEKTFITE